MVILQIKDTASFQHVNLILHRRGGGVREGEGRYEIVPYITMALSMIGQCSDSFDKSDFISQQLGQDQ